jgi:hypothetical protein
MNRICFALEGSYKDLKITANKNDFDKNILKSGIKYRKNLYKDIEKIYKEYKSTVKQYNATCGNIKKEERQEKRCVFLDRFKEKVFEICNNEKVVCDILIDMCYTRNESKQFVWDICGNTIIENLLEKNNYKIHCPVQDNNGDIEWLGYKYRMIEKDVRDIIEMEDIEC